MHVSKLIEEADLIAIKKLAIFGILLPAYQAQIYLFAILNQKLFGNSQISKIF